MTGKVILPGSPVHCQPYRPRHPRMVRPRPGRPYGHQSVSVTGAYTRRR